MSKLKNMACLLALTLSACGEPLQVGDKTYPTYGFLNASTHKSSEVCYEPNMDNVVWAVALAHTIVAPVYFFGWDIMEPVRVKPAHCDDCSIDCQDVNGEQTDG